MRERILSRAAEDGEFRSLLIADPKAAISAETGKAIPDGFDVTVHEDRPPPPTSCCRHPRS